MKTKYDELLKGLKSQIRGLLDNKEEIDSKIFEQVSNIDKSLDSLNEEHNRFKEENDALKEQLIESFKKGTSQEGDDSPLSSEEKTLDELLLDASKRVLSKQDN